MPARKQDMFVNKAFITVTETAANTLTFQLLQTGMNVFEKRAIILHALEYYPSLASANLVLDEGDALHMALTTSNSITSVVPNDANIVDFVDIRVHQDGTPATSWMKFYPVVRDFTGYPGGGLIIPAAPVYGAVEGVSLASAATIDLVLKFTLKELSASDYWELVEATRVIT